MKKSSLLFFLFVWCCFVYAQHPEIKRTNHWYFGQNAGLDFSNDTVIADVNGAYDNYEATATISDTAGNLLFYTDAETVWNRNHQIMQNGTSIGGCWSSTQGALIVPQPGNDSIYYIFTTDCAENNLSNGLRYSVVNINLDSGNGAIIQKNVLLHTPVAEKLAGVHHANGVDVWVLTHEWNSSNFLAYRITSLGLDTIPVTSNIGSFHSGGTFGYDNSLGYLKFSPNGKKIVSIKMQQGSIEVFDFNNTTGGILNLLTLPPNPSDYYCNGFCSYWYYGASFSNDNSKLYISRTGLPGEADARIYQYNLIANNINESRLIIANTNKQLYALQNGRDNKIYVALKNASFDNGYLTVINSPNKVGGNVNYVQGGINLNGKYNRDGLPNFIESYFNCDTCTVDSTTSVSFNQFNNNISVFPNPFDDILFINSSETIVSFTIKDINEITIYERVLDIPQYNIEISNLTLPQGVYTIFVNTKSFNLVQKLIKLTNK